MPFAELKDIRKWATGQASLLERSLPKDYPQLEAASITVACGGSVGGLTVAYSQEGWLDTDLLHRFIARKSRIRISRIEFSAEWDLETDVILEDDVLLIHRASTRIVYGDELTWVMLLSLYAYWPERTDYFEEKLHTHVPMDFEVCSLGGDVLQVAAHAWHCSLRDIVMESRLGANEWNPEGRTFKRERIGQLRGKPYHAYVDTINKPPSRGPASKSKVRR
jgi:hypothetical protein